DRQNAAQNKGLITLAGSTITGPGASVTGNSLNQAVNGNIATANNITIGAANIFISTRSINFGTARSVSEVNTTGIYKNGNVTAGSIAGQLAQATNLTLRSFQTIGFTGAKVNFALGAGSHLILDSATLISRTAGSDIQLGADRIDLVYSGSANNLTAGGT